MKLPRSTALALALLAATTAASAATPASTLPLYVGQPLPGAQVMFGDFDVQQPLTADTARITDPKQPNAVVEARRTGKDANADALGLNWKDAWFATVRLQSEPLDLRPYLAKGTVSFDLKVNELAKGGLAFRLDCGNNCERKISDVIPARAAQGKGWQHVSYALSCFHTKGDDFSAVKQPFALDTTGSGDVEIANIRIDRTGKPSESCLDLAKASVTPSPLNESWSLDWWMPRHQEKLAEIERRKAAGEPTDLVFIGDSITHNWEQHNKALWDEYWGKYHALNLGYGGDRTENVLWRLQHGEIDGIKPKVIVMMIGTNNTGFRHEAPELIYTGIKRDIQEIQKHQPHAKLLLLAIFPRGEKPDDTQRVLNEKVNAMLPKLADNKRVFFLNINKAFLAPDGTLSKDIMPDLLHPNAEGYKIWQREMQPELDKLMH